MPPIKPHCHSVGIPCQTSTSRDQLSEDQAEVQTIESLKVAFSLIVILTILEIGLGWISHSLTVLADAGHLISDSWVMGLVLLTTWLRLHSSHQPHHQFEGWISLVNSVILISVGVWIGWEAILQLQEPALRIAERPMLLAAILNITINSLNAWILHQHSHDDQTIKVVFLHVLSDALGALGILVAAVGIWQGSWLRADSVVSLGIASFIIYSALPLLIQSLQTLRHPTQSQNALWSKSIDNPVVRM